MSDTSATGLPIMTSGDAPNIPADVGINLAGMLRITGMIVPYKVL